MRENKNLIIALVLSSIVIIGWSFIFPSDNKNSSKKNENVEIIEEKNTTEIKQTQTEVRNISTPKEGKLIEISNGNLTLNIDTAGLKIKNIELESKHHSDMIINKNLLAQFGFISNTHIMPNTNTIWQVKKSGKNYAEFVTKIDNIIFTQKFELDTKSMVKISGFVKNNTKFPISFMTFSRVNQHMGEIPPKNTISHEGLIAFAEDKLYEKAYSKVVKKNLSFDTKDDGKSWLGFAEKYTMIAFVNQGEQKISFSFKNNVEQNKNMFQTDGLSQTYALEPNANFEYNSLLFIGTKHLKTLENYAKEYDIPSFDKAIDFGALYFITKPIFIVLSFIQKHVGNFAISIILLTLLLKILLLPLTVKSSISMAKMKNLQPDIKAVQEQFKNNKQMLGQEVIKIYKKNNVNPLAGCFPMLLQIPIFFALYKVLYVSIEMKNAPLFLWIKDLSMPDPLSILNLYGLFDWNAPPFLGLLPVMFGFSMYLYQKVSPQPTESTQATMMKFLPVIMTVFMSGFASGLLFYWIISNFISAIQQFVLEKFVIVKHIRKF